MGQPLELAGSYLKTEEGNEAHYYGGGGVAYNSIALACAGVPLAVRKGKTVGVWEDGKVVEYIWHTDTSNSGLTKKTADIKKVTDIRPFASADDLSLPTELAIAKALSLRVLQVPFSYGAPGTYAHNVPSPGVVVDDATSYYGKSINIPQGSASPVNNLHNIYGPYTPDLGNGKFNFVFGGRTNGMYSNAGNFLLLDVLESLSTDSSVYKSVAGKYIRYNEFKGDGTWTYFNIDFEARKGYIYEMRLHVMPDQYPVPVNFYYDYGLVFPAFGADLSNYATKPDVASTTGSLLKRTSDTFDGVLQFQTTGADKNGLRWAANSDHVHAYLRSTTDRDTQFVIDIGDNSPKIPDGVAEGFVIAKNVIQTDNYQYPAWDMFTVSPSELSYNADGSAKRDIWHSGLLPKGTPGQSIRVKTDGTAFEAFDPGDTAAVSAKEDKLVSYYATQTASFSVASDMVDKTVRCNHATVGITATIANDSQFPVGAKFIIRQSGAAPITLAAGGGITLNAPQGVRLARQFSYMQVSKQAANTYAVSLFGDVIRAVNYGWAVPRVTQPPDYFENAIIITKVTTLNVATLKYNIGNGAPVAVPLTLTGANGVATPNIAIPAGSWLIWAITYQSGAISAGTYINYQ